MTIKFATTKFFKYHRVLAAWLLFLLSFSSHVPRPTFPVFSIPSVEAASINQICFTDQCVMVEIADNDESRARGLQGRTTLDANRGMLFVFPQQGHYNFWMKDTLIPLDMIWLDRAMRVVDIKLRVPPCHEDPCPTVTPSGQASYVLEINAGVSEKFGISIGDQAEYK